MPTLKQEQMSDSIVFNEYTLSDSYEEYKSKPFYKKKKYIIPFLLVISLVAVFCFHSFLKPHSSPFGTSRSTSAKEIARLKYNSITSMIENFNLEYVYIIPSLFAQRNEIISYAYLCIDIKPFLEKIKVENPSSKHLLISYCLIAAIRSDSTTKLNDIFGIFPYYSITEDDLIIAIYFNSHLLLDMIAKFTYSRNGSSSYGMSAYGFYTMFYRSNHEDLNGKYGTHYKDDLGNTNTDYIKFLPS